VRGGKSSEDAVESCAGAGEDGVEEPLGFCGGHCVSNGKVKKGHVRCGDISVYSLCSR